VDDV
jgi:hypothetical protein